MPDQKLIVSKNLNGKIIEGLVHFVRSTLLRKSFYAMNEKNKHNLTKVNHLLSQTKMKSLIHQSNWKAEVNRIILKTKSSSAVKSGNRVIQADLALKAKT